jgi:RNA polymerase sigma factor (sigma-70 family)
MTDVDLERWVREANAGSRQALERILDAIQDKVYGLCVRMLWHPEDARDATQEILIRVMTRLANFRGESAFRTWVFRVGVNYLLDVRKSRMEA